MLLFLLLWALLAAPSPPLSLSFTTPIRGFEPLDIHARVSLVPSDHNRSICVLLGNVDTGAETTSCRLLRGVEERPTLFYDWKKRTAGRWVVSVMVWRDEGKPLEAQKIIEVLSTQ